MGTFELVRNIWSRERIRERLVDLDNVQRRSRTMFEAMQQTIDQLVRNNHELDVYLKQLEAENRELKTTVERFEAQSRRINPNAKCPSCGAEHGHLLTVVRDNQVRCVNHCDECTFTFISGPPVAGEDLASQLYQAPQGLL